MARCERSAFSGDDDALIFPEFVPSALYNALSERELDRCICNILSQI